MTDDEFLVLNAIYLRKIASHHVVGECTYLTADKIMSILSAAEVDNVVVDVGGIYMLSDSGTQAILQAYATKYSGLREGDDVEKWYQRFELLNAQFLTAISAWQTDGADPGRLDRLLRLVERHIKSLAAMEVFVPRYRLYADRFERALGCVDRGDLDFVVSPHVDSIHNVWFEFHEDILTLLGRPRDVAEAAQG